MKLPGGSFPVEREEASRWKGRKFPDGEGGSFTAGSYEASQWEEGNLQGGKL